MYNWERFLLPYLLFFFVNIVLEFPVNGGCLIWDFEGKEYTQFGPTLDRGIRIQQAGGAYGESHRESTARETASDISLFSPPRISRGYCTWAT